MEDTKIIVNGNEIALASSICDDEIEDNRDLLHKVDDATIELNEIIESINEG